MVIFTDLEDCKRVYENDPYFLNNLDLFMTFLGECYNLDKVKFQEALVFVWLLSLEKYLWELEILKGMGNIIRDFV